MQNIIVQQLLNVIIIDFKRMSNPNNPCLFCNINQSGSVHENDFAYTSYDSYPVSKYHCLIIPKRHIKDYFDLSNRKKSFPLDLSGGEKQRVSSMRAIINKPSIVIADEPTGSLDFETAKGIFEILKDQINSKRLIIFATHNRFFANKSDCLLEIVNGNIKTING